MRRGAPLLVLSLLLAEACSPGQPAPVDGGPVCSEPSPPPCAEELKAALELVAGDPSPGTIENQPDGDGFWSIVDATAGGLVADPRQSYLYARFTDEGLEPVALNDDEALASMDWDIAFHRYIVRLNGGSSGPSCVAAARISGAYDDVKQAPADGYRVDDQLDDQCAFRADTEAGDPGNERDWGCALREYYLYDGCLKMTGDVYAVRLADGRALKLTVTHYYAPDAQAQCDETGETTHQGAATLRIRWAFLDVAQ